MKKDYFTQTGVILAVKTEKMEEPEWVSVYIVGSGGVAFGLTKNKEKIMFTAKDVLYEYYEVPQGR